MSCTDRFMIDKATSNEFIFTIKQNDSTLPMVIDPSDTFKFKIVKLANNTVVGAVTMVEDVNSGVVEVYDAANGQIKVKLYDTFVQSLEVELRPKADRYYPKALYRAVIDCDTVNNGKFTAVIDAVYTR